MYDKHFSFMDFNPGFRTALCLIAISWVTKQEKMRTDEKTKQKVQSPECSDCSFKLRRKFLQKMITNCKKNDDERPETFSPPFTLTIRLQLLCVQYWSTFCFSHPQNFSINHGVMF